MLSIALCIVAAIVSFVASRKSLVSGLGVVLSVGYAYGIVRANIEQPGSHLLFDAAVGGLFVARVFHSPSGDEPPLPKQLVWWVALLMGWPLLLMAVPKQDTMVQLVGLRGNAFLLPFLLIGAQLTDDRKYRLALWCAVLNIAAFILAAVEFRFGVEAFFPRNAVTTIIYKSNDLMGATAYRIPSSFSNAHAFGGTMVMTLPLLLGAWLQAARPAAHKLLVATAILAASVGVLPTGSIPRN